MHCNAKQKAMYCAEPKPFHVCPDCGAEVILTDSSIIYGRSYGMIYYCTGCKKFVGVHAGTDIPKGTLADNELREMRKAAHAAFDPLWMEETGVFYKRRRSAYRWLTRRITGQQDSLVHIGNMDARGCNMVIKTVTAFNKKIEGERNNGNV